MTGTTPVVAPDAMRRLEDLQAALRNYPDRAIIPLEHLRDALDAWGFVRGKPLDPDHPQSATFHIIPAYTHLQTGIVGTGFAHPYKVEEIVGLIQSLRVHL